VGQPGAMTLFQAQPKEHLNFAKHLTAEVKTEEFISAKGLVTKWERLRRNKPLARCAVQRLRGRAPVRRAAGGRRDRAVTGTAEVRRAASWLSRRGGGCPEGECSLVGSAVTASMQGAVLSCSD
jgi:hypothetical protein